MVSHHVQFITVRGVVLILSESSKQHALVCRNGGISYRGVHFNVHRGMLGGSRCLFLGRISRHDGIIFRRLVGGLMLDQSHVQQPKI